MCGLGKSTDAHWSPCQYFFFFWAAGPYFPAFFAMGMATWMCFSPWQVRSDVENGQAWSMNTYTDTQAGSFFPLFLNCTRRQMSGQRWSPMNQEAELGSHSHRPIWVVRLTKLVYFLPHCWDFGLNPACFEYIYHCLLPLVQNHANFSITPVAWFLSPGLSSLKMLYLAYMTPKVESPKWNEK